MIINMSVNIIYNHIANCKNILQLSVPVTPRHAFHRQQLGPREVIQRLEATTQRPRQVQGPGPTSAAPGKRFLLEAKK